MALSNRWLVYLRCCDDWRELDWEDSPALKKAYSLRQDYWHDIRGELTPEEESTISNLQHAITTKKWSPFSYVQDSFIWLNAKTDSYLASQGLDINDLLDYPEEDIEM